MSRLLLVSAAVMALTSGCSGAGSTVCCVENRAATDPGDGVLRVLTLNLAHGRKDSFNQMFVSTKQTYKNLDGIADLLLRINPDLAAFQEADGVSRWSGKFDHVAYLADRTGWPNYVHGRHADGWLYNFGTAILSRHEFTATQLHNFKQSFPTTTKGFVAATVEWRQDSIVLPLTVLSVHLDFFRQSVREEQVDELANFVSGLEGPFIIMGDFNSEWEEDDSTIRELVERLNLKVFEPEATTLGTYKSAGGKRLDWMLISSGLEFVSHEVLPDIVSDHFAVVAEVAYGQP